MSSIGIDVDGVLADFVSSYIRLLNQIAPEVIVPPGYQPTCWDFMGDLGFSPTVITVAQREINGSRTFWEELNSTPTSEVDLKTLGIYATDHDIYFITDRRGRTAKQQTERWLLTHGYGLRYPTVLLSARKHAIAEGLQLDILIDDRPENLIGLPDRTYPVLINRPWNQGASVPYRARTVKEALEVYWGIGGRT